MYMLSLRKYEGSREESKNNSWQQITIKGPFAYIQVQGIGAKTQTSSGS